MPSIPKQRRPHQHSTDDRPVTVGVDTHKDIHVAAVLSELGALLGTAEFPTTAAGYRQLLAWVRGLGTPVVVGVECTGSFGQALTRHLHAQGVAVVEVNAPDKATRRRRGKTDALDAEAAARAVLSGRATAIPKTADGPVEMIRMFKVAKASAIKSRTQAVNQFKAILVDADPSLRESITGRTYRGQVKAAAALTELTPHDHTSAAIYTLRLLAHRILHLTSEIKDLQKKITTAVRQVAPELLERRGVGYDSAAGLLITAGDNPDRLTSEASFAALCGASPVEASSGNSHHLRLNRGGDRQANAALYRIALTRLRYDPDTQAYYQRRINEGKTRRAALRCLKRYIARELYPLLKPATLATSTT